MLSEVMGRSTGRMQHLLGVTSLWVLMPASIHVFRNSPLDVAWILVALQFTVCAASVLYWRHYDQSSVAGGVDTAGSVLTLPALALRSPALREMGALLSAVFFFYRLSVHLRAKNRPLAGLAAHATFRFCAFWLATHSLTGRSAYSFAVVVGLTLLYATQCLAEFLFFARYCDGVAKKQQDASSSSFPPEDDARLSTTTTNAPPSTATNAPSLYQKLPRLHRLYGRGLLRSGLLVLGAALAFVASDDDDSTVVAAAT